MKNISALLIGLLLPCFAPAARPAPHVSCVASWYGEEERGHLMANGQPFNPDALTCASWFYPLGARLLVTHHSAHVTVWVTDRGPARRLVRQGRKIDLSRAAFARLADPRLGLIHVTIRRLP